MPEAVPASGCVRNVNVCGHINTFPYPMPLCIKSMQHNLVRPTSRLWLKMLCPPDFGRKEENVLFNDALNTFYLRLFGIRHMVKDHSDSEKGNPLPPHRLLFTINSKGSFICTISQTG